MSVSNPSSDLGATAAISDALIEAALARTEIIPEFVSWHGQGRVTVRIQADGCRRYAEFVVGQHHDENRIVEEFERASRELG